MLSRRLTTTRMGDWYRVVKTIKGHRYVYLQQTYREGSRVRTRTAILDPREGGVPAEQCLQAIPRLFSLPLQLPKGQ
jgi:hypothetical protein